MDVVALKSSLFDESRGRDYLYESLGSSACPHAMQRTKVMQSRQTNRHNLFSGGTLTQLTRHSGRYAGAGSCILPNARGRLRQNRTESPPMNGQQPSRLKLFRVSYDYVSCRAYSWSPLGNSRQLILNECDALRAGEAPIPTGGL
jgi:hypothetical protein